MPGRKVLVQDVTLGSPPLDDLLGQDTERSFSTRPVHWSCFLHCTAFWIVLGTTDDTLALFHLGPRR